MATQQGERDGKPSPARFQSLGLWAPFHHTTFTVLWTATLVSNIGTWMYNSASGWLITTLAPDPLVVSLVQVAANLPMFLLALPAGALADLVDKRRLLIAVQLATIAVSALFAASVSLALVTPAILLAFAFLIGVGGVMIMPAWQAIVPQLVPKQVLAPAITANSVGVNISRALGPALGGALIGALGIAAPFWLNAVSNLGVVAALLWWRPTETPVRHLPGEHFWHAIAAGVRYSRNNPNLIATMLRGVAFFLFATAYWALLPLVARNQIGGGPALYGILLGSIGAGAVGGAFLLPWLKKTLGPDLLVAAGTLASGVALVLFGVARQSLAGVLASLIAGASWIAVLATLNISAQLALPEWVRARGLAAYLTVVFGGMTLGSAVWGKTAQAIGLPTTHFIACIGAVAGIPLTWRWKLQASGGVDLTPSMHWPVPITTTGIERDRGPVLVTVEYRIDPKQRREFLTALENFAHERRRDGAYGWGVFEDAAEEGRLIETFFVSSWLEHLRQHERVTQADRVLQEAVVHFAVNAAPKVSHFIAADSYEQEPTESGAVGLKP